MTTLNPSHVLIDDLKFAVFESSDGFLIDLVDGFAATGSTGTTPFTVSASLDFELIAALDNLRPISVLMRVKVVSVSASNRRLAGKGSLADGGWEFRAASSSNKTFGYFNDGTGGDLLMETANNSYVLNGSFVDLAFRWDGNYTGDQIFIDVDGTELQGTTSGSNKNDGATEFKVGKDSSTFEYEFITVFDRMLSKAEADTFFAAPNDLILSGGDFSIDTIPVSIVRGGAEQDVIISNPTTAPTSGNTEVRWGGSTGPLLTLGTITGAGPYTIPVSAPVNTAYQNGLHPIWVKVDVESTSASSTTLLPVATKDYIDLLGSLQSTPAWETGRSYGIAYADALAVIQGDIITNAGNSYRVESSGTLNATAPTFTTSTLNTASGVDLVYLSQLTASNIAEVEEAGEIFGRTTSVTSSSTTPADSVDGWSLVRRVESILDGYSGLTPLPGDQIVYDKLTSGSISVDNVSSIGVITLASLPASTQTISRHIIGSGGLIGDSQLLTLLVDGSAVSLTSSTSEIGDTQVVSISVIPLPGIITNQTEDGDLTVSNIDIIVKISSTQSEDGDVTTVSMVSDIIQIFLLCYLPLKSNTIFTKST